MSLSFSIEAQRFETNEEGIEVKIGMDESVQIGIFSGDPKNLKSESDILYLKPHRINKNQMEFKISVSEIPSYVSIDPYFTRLDRNALNNSKLVSSE